MRLILASQSPARLSVLRSAGVEPVVRVSGVDEDALIASLADPTPEETVVALSAAKAEAIEHDDECVVIGCDSMLLFDGELVGKPGTPEAAKQRWLRVAGKSGVLITGHTVLRVSGGAVIDRASAAESTVVRFGTPTEEELDAYIATGEPLHVAGGFTIDGQGGWFIDGIEGDHTSVIGISLPLTRRLLGQVGVPVSTIWSRWSHLS